VREEGKRVRGKREGEIKGTGEMKGQGEAGKGEKASHMCGHTTVTFAPVSSCHVWRSAGVRMHVWSKGFYTCSTSGYRTR
jgi:hypothetical protein